MGSGRRFTLLLLLFCAVLTAVWHTRPIMEGRMVEDDFLADRPWSTAEVLAAVHGTWTPGLDDVDRYNRPLTSLYQAAAFELFGWNSAARHIVSLVLLSLCAWLLGLFVAGELGLTWGWLGAALYIAYPLVPHSAAAWGFNQLHQFASLSVLCGILVWQRRARRGASRHWIGVWGLFAAGALFKEDSAVLFPVLLAWHWLRARTLRDVPALPRIAWAGALATVAALLTWRVAVYPDFESFHTEKFTAGGHTRLALECFKHGLGWMGLDAGDLQVPLASSVLALGVVMSGLLLGALARWRTKSAWLTASAFMLLSACAAGMVTITNTHHTRSHLIALASVMLIVSAIQTMADRLGAVAGRPARVAMAAVTVVVLAGFALGARSQDRVMWPCSDDMIESVGHTATEYYWLDPTVRQWLASRAARCATGFVERENDLSPVVVWHPPVWGKHGLPYTVAMLSAVSRNAMVTLRAAQAADGAPVVVDLGTDGGHQRVTLNSPEWTTVRVPLVRGWRRWRVWLRQSQLLTIRDADNRAGIEISDITLDAK